jgi:putative transposase
LKRIFKISEEYGIGVIYVDEAYTSSRCPLHGDGCGARISRGLFRCMKLNRVFNADLAAAYNILLTPITSSLERGRGNGPETRPRAKPPERGNVAQTSLPQVGRRSYSLYVAPSMDGFTSPSMYGSFLAPCRPLWLRRLAGQPHPIFPLKAGNI